MRTLIPASKICRTVDCVHARASVGRQRRDRRAAGFAPPPAASPEYTVAQATAAGPHAHHAHQSRVKVGDLVRPSNGGPLMTVRAIKHGVAICDWQSWDGVPSKARFPIGQLVVIGGPGFNQGPLTEPHPYRPCPANVITKHGRHECLG